MIALFHLNNILSPLNKIQYSDRGQAATEIYQATERQNKLQFTHFLHVPSIPSDVLVTEGQFCKYT